MCIHTYREGGEEREGGKNGFTYSEFAEEPCPPPPPHTHTHTHTHTYVYRAEVLAAEIKELQGEMADYNTVRLGSVERCLYE